MNAAGWLLTFGQIDQGIEQYRLAIKQDPQRQDARLALARLLGIAKKDVEASKDVLAPCSQTLKMCRPILLWAISMLAWGDTLKERLSTGE